MTTESVLEEIQDLNLTYLLLAQRLLKEDYDTALVRLKIERPMAELLVALSAKQLGQLARTNQFLFRLCLDDPDQVRQVTGNKRAQGLEQTHAALLMASSGSA